VRDRVRKGIEGERMRGTEGETERKSMPARPRNNKQSLLTDGVRAKKSSHEKATFLYVFFTAVCGEM
jgi:hypothetical protein